VEERQATRELVPVKDVQQTCRDVVARNLTVDMEEAAIEEEGETRETKEYGNTAKFPARHLVVSLASPLVAYPLP